LRGGSITKVKVNWGPKKTRKKWEKKGVGDHELKKGSARGTIGVSATVKRSNIDPTKTKIGK